MGQPQNKAHLTAISRNKTSAPMRWLSQNGILKTSLMMLDYGCGKGYDASQFGMDKYDPYYFDTVSDPGYDVITCNYVLNVISSHVEIHKCIKKIQYLLDYGGRAYITVRRDIHYPTITKRGTFQRPVYLTATSLKKTSTYEIYEISKGDDIDVSILKPF